MSATVDGKDFWLKISFKQTGSEDSQLAFCAGLVKSGDDKGDSIQKLVLRRQLSGGFAGVVLLQERCTGMQLTRLASATRAGQGGVDGFRSIDTFESQRLHRLDHRKYSCTLIEILRTSAISLAFTHWCPVFP